MMKSRKNPYESQMEGAVERPAQEGMRYAADLIGKAGAAGVPIEPDPAVLRETADVDLERQVPPQVYAVVAGVMDLIRKLEEGKHREGGTGKTGTERAGRP